MKSTTRKILAVALVLMMTLPLVAFPMSADESAQTGIEPIYTVNFKGDSNMAALTEAWDGFGNGKITPSDDGSSVTLKIQSGKWAAASAKLEGLYVQNGAYTFVFTVTASDDNEEIGILLDHQTGFVVNPGQNTFRYTDHLNDTTPIETTEYDGTGELTQTYAIEVAGEGTGENSKGQPYVDITTYKLYNLTNGNEGKMVWNLACELTAAQLSSFLFDWGDAGDCDGYFYSRLSRDRKNFDNANDGTITVSDFKVYEGLAATNGLLETPEIPEEPEPLVKGVLLYDVDFRGNDGVFDNPKGAWSGAEVTKTQTSVTMSTKKDGNESQGKYRASVWGADLKDFTVLNKAYTVVFTLTASDADEEIGFLPDDWAGFVVTPGQNAYKFITTTKNGTNGTDGQYAGVIASGTYEGTGALSQTYAIELAASGTPSADGSSEAVTAYKLYVLVEDEWVLVCSLTDEQMGGNIFDWFYNYEENGQTLYEDDFTLRFYRRYYALDADGNATATQDETQNGTVTVSDMKIYKDLAITNPLEEIPDDDVTEEPVDENLLYEVDFRGDDVFNKPGGSWSGALVATTKTSVTMSTKVDSSKVDNRGSAWGADLQGYTVLGNSYTVVFTLAASDVNEEIGFLPDDWAGFVITPGRNSYRFITTKYEDRGMEGAYEKVITSGEYAGAKSMTQTYAVEIKTSGTQENPSIDAYNLYVAQNGEWVLVCALTDEQMDVSYFDWFYNYEENGQTLYEDDLTMRFYRRYYALDEDGWTTDEADTTQNGTVTVSDAKLYQGNVVTDDLLAAPETTVVPPTESDESGNSGSNDGSTDDDDENSGNDSNDGNDDGNADNGTADVETQAPETEAPVTTETEAETEEEGGCGSSLAMTGVALVGACAAMLAIKRRKNEDD